MIGEATLMARIVVAFASSYVLGFEREVRGATVGDRTFALVGTAAAAVTAVSLEKAPHAIGGIVTGVGFIGAGVLFRGESGLTRGVTTAATLFLTASVGIVAGTGHLMGCVLLTALMILLLEIRHVPGLRLLDARRWEERARNDAAPPGGKGPGGTA